VDEVNRFRKGLLDEDVELLPSSLDKDKKFQVLKKDNVSPDEVVEIVNALRDSEKKNNIRSYEPITTNRTARDYNAELIDTKYNHLMSIFIKSGNSEDEMEWENIKTNAQKEASLVIFSEKNWGEIGKVNDRTVNEKLHAVLIAEKSQVVAKHNALNLAFEKRMKTENRNRDLKNENDKRVNKSPIKEGIRAKKLIKGDD
jgi:hypothetical protein